MFLSFSFRFYTMVMILGLHSMIFIGYGYTENPEFIENVSRIYVTLKFKLFVSFSTGIIFEIDKFTVVVILKHLKLFSVHQIYCNLIYFFN